MLHNSNLALAGISTSLLFTQSYSHTKSLFSFRNTRISRFLDSLFLRQLKCLRFTLYVTIFVLKSFSFQLLLSSVRSDFRLYFVSVLLNIYVSLFVSVNEIIYFSVSISISVNEYITGGYPRAVLSLEQGLTILFD